MVALQVSAGTDHTCALKADGTVACFGDNKNRQSTLPSGAFVQITAGGYPTCGLDEAG